MLTFMNYNIQFSSNSFFFFSSIVHRVMYLFQRMSRPELIKTMKKSKQVLKGIAKNCAIQTEFVVIMCKG